MGKLEGMGMLEYMSMGMNTGMDTAVSTGMGKVVGIQLDMGRVANTGRVLALRFGSHRLN